jgi:succinate dehydrogenase / fumarate reductase cytochrome b subunit
MAIKLSRTFVLRKLHQLTGIMPLGLFLLEHFYTNSKALQSAKAFNEAVIELQNIPYIVLLEVFGILLPLTYHAVYGLFITFEAKPNNLAYGYARNWFYTLQRVTGVILFFFILFHVLNFRFALFANLGLTPLSVAKRPDIAFDLVRDEFRKTWVFVIYVIGISSTVYHFANGLWLFIVDWGLAIGERAQRFAGYACAGLGAVLLAVGLNAAAAFIRNGGLLGGIWK